MIAAESLKTARYIACLLAAGCFASPLLAQTPAKRAPHTFAPSAPGQKVQFRSAGDNTIEIAAKPGTPTLADKAIANRNAKAGASNVRQASTTRMMQEAQEEVPAPVAKPQGEKSVVVPSKQGVVMEEIPPGHSVLQGPYLDSSSGQVIGDHYDQPFFAEQNAVSHGGVIMDDGMAAEGCSDCGCGGTVIGGMRIARPCADGCLIPCPQISIDNTQVFAGAQSFQNVQFNNVKFPSFGVHEGVNLGGPFPFLQPLELSMQLGVMGTHSDFYGTNLTPSTRNQLFTTVGLFHRVDWGFQGGVVFDYMSDSWNYQIDMYQLRGDISWVNPQGHELGFWFTTSTDSQTGPVNTFGRVFQTSTWSQTDIYAFYYRKRFCETNAVIRAFGGATQDGDGIAGADAMAPLNDSFAISGGFTYFIPNNKANNIYTQAARESWNLQLSLVWFPGAGARQWTYHRPLLDVANNGTFWTKRVP